MLRDTLLTLPPLCMWFTITKGKRGYLSVLAFWSNDTAPAARLVLRLWMSVVISAYPSLEHSHSLSLMDRPPFCQPHFPLSKFFLPSLCSPLPFRSRIPKLTEIEIYMCIQDKKVPRSRHRVFELLLETLHWWGNRCRDKVWRWVKYQTNSTALVTFTPWL